MSEPCPFHPKHLVYRMQVCGKLDSFEVYCDCGAVRRIGVWYHEPPPGWGSASDDWAAIIEAGEALIRSFYGKSALTKGN